MQRSTRRTAGSPRRLQGRLVDRWEPDWSLILGLVGTELTSWFMWMGEVLLSDGVAVHVFKHRETRANVHIAADGRTLYYDWDGVTLGEDCCDYVEHPRTRAIDMAFRGWGAMLDEREATRAWTLIDHAWAVADAGNAMPVDPRELELQRAFDAERHAHDVPTS